MNFFVLWIVVLFVGSAQATIGLNTNISSHFEGQEACFILRDLKTGKDVIHFGGDFCQKQVFACSTFKVPLALMAIEHGLIQDESTPFKWDGTTHEIEAWNRNQTAKTWISDSVVWVSQELTPKLGMSTIKNHLKDFKYGNQDMSGGITQAWLSSTLQISAEEQIDFLQRLWKDELKLNPKSATLTKKLTYAESSPSGAILHGKTGSGSTPAYRIGWYVGYLKKNNEEYIFALDFKDSKKPLSKAYAGREARELFKKIMSERGLF